MTIAAARTGKKETLDGATVVLTVHARRRMTARRISRTQVNLVVEYGRMKYVKGARYHSVGRNEVAKHLGRGVDLRAVEGIHVVACTRTDFVEVITVYRNHNFRGLRPRGR